MDAASPILLVTRGLDPVGTGRQVELAAEGLTAWGYRLVVAVTTGGGSLAARLAARGCAVHAVGRRPLVDLAAAARLARLAARLRPAAILGFGRSQIWPLVAAKRAAPQGRTLAWLGLAPRRRHTAWGLARLDGAIAASAAVGQACRRQGLGAKRIVVVPPGAGAAAGAGLSREAVAEHLGLDPARHWTLAVAPLETEPRLRLLLWAIDQLGVVRRDLQHVLVGRGPLLEHLRRRARAQELSERLFVVPDCEVIQDLLGEVRLVWQSGDVALGGALLDGMARGVPAVAVASDASRPLVVDGETGRLVPAAPESEFPRRAFGILEDAELARRYGGAGAARAVGEFSAERFVAGLADAMRLGDCP